MLSFFQDYKKSISTFLHSFLLQKKEQLRLINLWGQDSVTKLLNFVDQGKMLRGSLILFSYDLFQKKKNEELIKVAAALELIHSSLLIHDDIMDRDELRRGKKTMHTQYAEHDTSMKDSQHFGEGMAICVGDMGFFFAYEILSTLNIEKTKKDNLIELFSKELMNVCLAQMQDLSAGASKKEVSEEDVLSLYKNKTARYTFSLPFMLGALLAGQHKKVLDQLSLLGEYLGLIFQIKDDELGIFGEEKTTGKPLGSDIKEGKQTLFSLYLFQTVTPEEKKRLQNIFGNASFTKDDLRYVRHLIEHKNIFEKVNHIIKKFKTQAEHLISNLPISSEKKKELRNLLEYNLERQK
ncbi:polyprenyl synthetase family protein [Candidatus Woesearchaeota archaeon]|nr:polyprenyl synthetase family protein [Candidatus Woesearchaeota archaeon]